MSPANNALLLEALDFAVTDLTEASVALKQTALELTDRVKRLEEHAESIWALLETLDFPATDLTEAKVKPKGNSAAYS